MSNELRIHLNRTDFTGGEKVTGELEVDIEKAIPVRGIRIVFHGYEQSYWIADLSGGSSAGRGRTKHSEMRDLFNEEITLFGDPPLDTATLIADSFEGLFHSDRYHTLDPGNYRYDFSFTLPDELPGDYEDSANRSKIRYLVKAYLDIPLKIDIEQTIPLTIHETYDQGAVQSVSAVSEITLFEKDSFVKMEASLEKDTFFPGETLDCRLMVENKSGRNINAVVINLKKIESLQAHSASDTRLETIHSAKYVQSGVSSGEPEELNLQFSIPFDLYPSIVSSELTKVEYRVVFALEIPWQAGLDIPLAINFDVELPIVIREEDGNPAGPHPNRINIKHQEKARNL